MTNSTHNIELRKKELDKLVGGAQLKQYRELIEYILLHGNERGDRTGTGTVSIFGYHKPLVFDVDKAFPAISDKSLAWNPMISELLWFLSGSTNLGDLKEIQFGDRNSTKRTVWDDNYENEGAALGYARGEMGPIYGEHMGKQWVDCLMRINNNPEDRRIVMSNWQFEDLRFMTLPPCHGIHTQFYVENGKLHLNTTMRSTDVFLGLPFNIASYASMLIITAKLTGLRPGKMKMYLLGDVHIYQNHMDQVEELLKRQPMDVNEAKLVLPEDISLPKILDRQYSASDIYLENYRHQGKIAAPMAFKKN